MATQTITSQCFDGAGNRLVTTTTASESYGVPETTLRDWARKKKVPTVRCGKLWKFIESALAAYIAKRGR